MRNEVLWEAIASVVSAINHRNATPSHSVNVANLSVLIAQKLGWESTLIEEIRIGALLHDIGQISFPDQMINDKDYQLTPDDKKSINEHPIKGAELIQNFPLLNCARPYILLHQENIDGTGYPFGMKGDDIPLEVQVVAVADVYDALRHSRYYLNRGGHSHIEAIEKMKLNRSNHWKEEVFDAFIDVCKEWT